MPTLTPTKKAFLEEVLEVKPKKKGLLSKGPGDENVQATAAFKAYRKTEEAVIKKIAEFDKYDDTDGEKLAFEKRVKTIQDEVARTNKQDALAAKNTLLDKQIALQSIGDETDEALVKAGLRAAFKKECVKAEELLDALTSKNVPEMTFDVPLKNVVDDAKTQKGDETPDAATRLKTESKRIFDAQNVKVGVYAKCATELEKALANLAKLKALNRGGKKYDTPLDDLIEAAKKKLAAAKADSAENDDVAEAQEILKGAEAKYGTQTQMASQDQENDLDAARYRPVYEDKLARVREAIDELTPLHGTKPALVKLNGLIAKAKPFADTGKFQAAYDALAGLTAFRKEGTKAAEEFLAGAGGTACAVPLAKARAALEAFRRTAGLAEVKAVDDANAKLEKILSDLDQPNPHPSVVAEMIDKANALALSLKNKTAELEKRLEEATAAYETANAKFGELKMKSPLSAWETYREGLRSASALLGIQQYENARNELDSLTAQMTNAHESATANFTNWERLLKEHETNRDVIDKALGISNKTVSTLASSVEAVFRTLPAEMVRTHDYAMGCAEAQSALNKLPKVRENLAAYQKLADEMSVAKGAIDKKAKEVLDAIESHADCDLSDFRTRLDPALDAWKEEVDTLFASGKKVSDFKDQTLAALAKIISDMDLELNKPGETDRRVKQAGAKKIENDFKTAKTQASQAIRRLSEDDPAKAKLLQGKFDVIVQRVAGPAGLKDDDLADLVKVKEDADADAQGFQDQVEVLRQEAALRATELQNELKALEKANKDYKDYFTDLRDRIDDCRGLYESSVLAVVQKGKLQLEQVAREIAAVKANNAKGSGSAQTFGKVEEKIKEIKKIIEKNELLKECLPSKRKVLSFRIEKEVPEQTKKVSPEKALADVLRKFETEVNEAIAKATEANTKRTANEQTATTLKEKLKTLTTAPKLKSSLTNRIEAALVSGEGGEEKASLDLVVIAQLITAAQDDPDARVAMERKANEDEFLSQEAVKQWEARSAVFEKNAKRKADAAYKATPEKDCNKALYKEIEDLFEQAKKQAKQGACLVALKKLDEAAEAANRFVANPLGGAATARNNLRKVDDEWRRAVASYVMDLNDMSKTIDAENKEDPKADVTKIKAQLTRVGKLFDAQIFAPFVATLTDEDAALPERRSAKEKALRFVREYRKALQSDKVLAYLSSKNPFLPSFSVKFVEAKINLLEVNLLRE